MPAISSAIQIISPIGTNKIKLLPLTEAGTYEIQDGETGTKLGFVSQPKDTEHITELFWGKGGFMGSIVSPRGIRYFALPGSSIHVGSVQLVLDGNPITRKSPSEGIKPLSEPNTLPQQKSIQATILGAGLATRFERISGDSTQYSKPAVPLAGPTSVIECIANHLGKHGFSNIIVNTYFKPESLKASLSRCKSVMIQYIDEAEPSGTAGGLRKLLLDPAYQGLLNRDMPLLVVQGDSVTDANFSDLMQAHMQHNALVSIGCQLVPEKDVSKFGVIVTDRSGQDGQSGRILEFQEKPSLREAKSRLGNTGFYILSPQAYPIVVSIYERLLKNAQEKSRQEGETPPTEVLMDFATDIFPALLKETQANASIGPFWAQTVEGYWSDIGNPSQYLETLHDVYGGKTQLPLPKDLSSYYREGIIYWEGAAAIADAEGAQLSGNVVVAKPYGET